MRAAEWIATQPLKATGTYGIYQYAKERLHPYGSPDRDTLGFAAFAGIFGPLTSRGIVRSTLGDDNLSTSLAHVGSFTALPLMDFAAGWYEVNQLGPEVSHVFPGTEHMLGGLAPFLIARAGVNLVSHLVADIAGLPSKARENQQDS